ncbi:hypothetical protein SprV_0401454200 [Sparganum proliferum]
MTGERKGAGNDYNTREVVSKTISTTNPITAVTSSTAAATTTVAVGSNEISEVSTPTFSTISFVHGADFAVTNSTAKVPVSAGPGDMQTINTTTTALPTAAIIGQLDTPNVTVSANAKTVSRAGTPTTTTSIPTVAGIVDLKASGGRSVGRRVHAPVSDPAPDPVSAPDSADVTAVIVVVAAEIVNPTGTTAGILVGVDSFPTTFPSTVSNPRDIEGVESIVIIIPALLITRPVGNAYLVSTIVLVTCPAAVVEDVDATAAAAATADAAVVSATTPIHFASLAYLSPSQRDVRF